MAAGNDLNSVDETVTLTHTATVGDDEDEVTLTHVSVTVNVKDNDPRGVTVTVTLQDGQLPVGEAASGMYTVQLDTQPTATVTVDVGGASGELTVSPSRLFFTPDNYSTPQPVRVYAGEDFDAGKRYRDPDTHNTRRRLHGCFGDSPDGSGVGRRQRQYVA